jgi:hypothetical protein
MLSGRERGDGAAGFRCIAKLATLFREELMPVDVLLWTCCRFLSRADSRRKYRRKL